MSFEIGFCLPLAMGEPSVALPRLRDYGFDGVELWPAELNQAWR